MEKLIGQKSRSASSERNSSLELFRIIVMILIVAHHYVANSGLTDLMYNEPFRSDSIFLFLFGAWGKTGINCFVMITGYFMCRSHITLKKFLKLILQFEFYNIVIYLIFLLTGYIEFDLKGLIKTLIPVYSVKNMFVSCFLLFYLLIPFLNILIEHMNEKQHIRLLLLLGFMYVIMGTIPVFDVTMNYVSWFTVLYFIASYIRIYDKPLFSKTKFWCICTLVLLAVSAASVLVCIYLSNRMGISKGAFYFLSDSNKILAVLLGISSFMLFKNIRMKYNRFINAVSACTFGVLLIHANSEAMRQWLWKDLLDNTGAFIAGNSIIHALLSVPAIFIVCNAIDQVRARVLEKPVMSLYDRIYPSAAEKWSGFEAKILKKLNIPE